MKLVDDQSAPRDSSGFSGFVHSVKKQSQPKKKNKRATSACASAANENLQRLIEAEIVPRLMLAAQDDVLAPPPERDRETVDRTDVDRLAARLVRQDLAGAKEAVSAVRLGGVPDELIFVDLVAPAARELGRMWEEDELDFAAVTIASGMLHTIIRHMHVVERWDPLTDGERRRVLLAPACGDQHILGLSLVGEFCRRGGWDVWQEYSITPKELTAMAQREWFDVVGLSSSRGDQIEQVAGEVSAVRAASQNPDVQIAIGGRMVDVVPEAAQHTGADCAVADASQVVAVFEDMCRQAARR